MGISRSFRRSRALAVLGASVALLVGSALVQPLGAQAAAQVSVSTAIARILSDTNQLRAQVGKPPLTENAALETVAQHWTSQMYANGAMTHNPNYASQIPSGWTGAAENIAYGYTYDTVVEAWHNSPGHYQNIIGDYTDIGIGYYESNGKRYFTQDFGRYASHPSATTTVSLGGRSVTVDRVWGNDRYSAAVSVAQTAYPNGAATVYVATGLNFPDALSASAAAAKAGAPLLLTDPNSLRADVADEIRALSPQNIVVVGGTASVSSSVYAALSYLAPGIQRLSGSDRYAASRAIVSTSFPQGTGTVYIATGATFPDALSASAAGGPVGAAVLLVDGSADGLDAATVSTLTALHPDDIIIAGGVNSVSTGIEQQLGTIASTTRSAGADRFAASAAISSSAYSSTSRVFLATGSTFPDALGGSAWAAALPAPLFVVPSTCVPADTLAAISDLGATKVTLLGGPSTLGTGVMNLTRCPAS